ncbi:acyl-CoA dehydrogenase family protein [Marisediminicola sp. LYQ85]|uniref:acyl-CoA dehydrogenase family protein n=1 Tax=Marisediminicola sp. LYQ85 TaxID=3391062 RepID=UPI00398314BA
MPDPRSPDPLSPDLLDRIRSRAAAHDRDNTFPHDDLADLAGAGYLRALVPAGFGGLGLSLTDVVRSQAALAGAAPATALAVGMHLIWTGVARTLWDAGDPSLEFVLRDAGAGEIFAFAISEAGNDLSLFGSTTVAEPMPDGAYAFTGTKIFTSLSPVFTRLATFGLDSVSPDAPKLVHAVLERDDERIVSLADWDTVGMRATQSHTTRLERARAEPSRVHRRLDAGPSADPLVVAIFQNFEILVSAVYVGIAERALDLAVLAARSRVSARSGLSKDADPATRRRVAVAALEIDAVRPRLESLARDVESSADHGDQWFRALVGLKLAATTAARAVVGEAITVAGGAAFASDHELSRLYRDVLAGGFHPSNDDAALSTVATAVLGPPPT